MKNRIFKIIYSISIFIMYYYFTNIVSFVFKLFKLNINTLNKWLVVIILFLMEIIPLLALIVIYRRDLKREFKTFKDNFKNNIDKYIRLWIFALVVMTVSNVLIELITGSNVSNNEQAIRNIMGALPIYMTFSSCICAPIAEELAYRKTIKNIFVDKKLSIVMSGLIFGLAHVIGTYSSITDLLYIIPYGIFGSVFMYIYIDGDSIYNSMFIHFVHNTLLIIAYLIRL